MRLLRKVLLLILTLLVIVVVLQNAEVVTLRFLVWDFSMSRIILLSLSVLVGFVMGFITAKLTARAR